jgi:predicted HicB family RNase H-like nuclease
MTKKSFDNLSPKKKIRKATNEQIEEVLASEEKTANTISKKQKSIQFNIKLPERVYNALNQKAQLTGLSKKAIVVQALLEKLNLDT